MLGRRTPDSCSSSLCGYLTSARGRFHACHRPRLWAIRLMRAVFSHWFGVLGITFVAPEVGRLRPCDVVCDVTPPLHIPIYTG